MAQPSYVPTTDAELDTWALNFSSKITAAPATYGLLASDAVAIANVVNPFDAAYEAAINPDTRGPNAVNQKNTTKATMLAVIRPYALNVRNNAGVTDANKLALGLNVPSGTRTPVLVPATQPSLSIIGAQPGQFTMRFHDPTQPTKARGKPLGARSIYVVASYGTVAGTDPDAATLLEIVTKQPFVANFDMGNAGKVATIWARWYGRSTSNPNGTGFGPWSNPVSQIVTF